MGYSRDEYVFACRGFGAIETDEELMAYAEKVTSNWCDAGWHRIFIDIYLSDYALSEPYRSLTKKEFARLKELQKVARDKHEKEEADREWKLIATYGYADNSVEEVYEDKDGVQQTVMVVGPHGDAC
jgi:hypothetical protein